MDNDKIDCAVIVVDSIKINDCKFSYNYCVKISDIEQTMKFLKVLYAEYNVPCHRIYLSGFACLNRSSVWEKQRMVEQVRREAKRINMLTQDIMNKGKNK